MRTIADGKVGIGIDNPSKSLQIIGENSFGTGYYLDNTSSFDIW